MVRQARRRVVNRLNFGCGTVVEEGWLNVDRIGAEYTAEEWAAALRVQPAVTLACSALFRHIPDGWCDYAVAHHSLQQVPYHELPGVLLDLARVLRPGGVLRVTVPDTLGAFRAYERGDRAWFPISYGTIDDALTAYLTWFSTNVVCFTPLTLMEALSNAGLSPMACTPSHTNHHDSEIAALDARPNESIWMEGMKL